jgi:hypothetical protein
VSRSIEEETPAVFDHIWHQISEHQGERFNRNGAAFRYFVHNHFIGVVDVASNPSTTREEMRIPKAHFEKALARSPVGPGELDDLIGGPYIYAIISDSRIARDEERVIHAFCSWLSENGWVVDREVKYVDVVAKRSGDYVYAEAKGKSAGPERRSMDVLYGQLLRRMTHGEAESVRYAAVVPDTSLKAALEVPERIRKLLQIDVFVVDENGAVREVD